MAKSKPTKSKIATEIKAERELKEKANKTFRLSVSLMKDFENLCNSQDLTQTEVLERLIKYYITEKW